MLEASPIHPTGVKKAILTLAALMLLGPAAKPAYAGGKLSFDDWLARQGTRCKDLDGDGKCCEPFDDQYIPADRSFINWFAFPAPGQGRVAVVDYLGLSAQYLAAKCGVELGTTLDGNISSHAAGDGRVLVSVSGHTTNALAFVVDDPGHTGDTRSTPLLFGERELDVCEGAPASVVNVEWRLEYYASPGQLIADLQWFGNPPPVLSCETADDPFDFRNIAFRASGDGYLADGTWGRLTINQIGILQSHSHSPHYDGFPVEFIHLHRLGQ